MDSVIEQIVGPLVAAADTRDDFPDADLFPGEEEAVARAIPKRRLEYTTARACAREAMERLGVRPAAILSGPRGEPRWPRQLVGSITHCDGYRGAVLGRRREVASIGIDAEPNAPLPDLVLEAVSSPRERVWVGEYGFSYPEVSWDRMLFCAKEAVYKVWYPLTNAWLDFDNAAITVDPDAGTFTARLLVPGPRLGDEELTKLYGRWAVLDSIILTAIVLTPAPAPTADPNGSPR